MSNRMVNSTRRLAVRSFRVDEKVWAAAKRRAQNEQDGTMSYVVAMLVESYAKGMIDLPKVQLVYQKPHEE